MASYGRLDVYWPDGNFQSFMLERSTVTVGRADGNTIVLDTDTLSRYHFSILHKNNSVSIMDMGSANGTFVDGTRLPANQAQVLSGVEEITVGHLRIVFHPATNDKTLPTAAITEDTHRVERPDAGCLLALDVIALDVWPASSSSAELQITNTGKEVRRFLVNVSGPQEKWIRVSRPDLDIYPGETARVLINVKPPRHPDVAPGIQPLTLRVVPVDKNELTAEISMQINVRGYSGLGTALANPHVEAGEPLRLYVQNQGNELLPLRVSGFDPGGGRVRFQLPDGPLMLAPGQRLQVRGEIYPTQRPLVGGGGEIPFHIHIRSQNAAGFLAVLEGKVLVRPRLPVSMAGALLIAGVMLLVVLGLAGALLISILNPAAPVLKSFQVNKSEVAQGEDILLSWESENVSQLSLRVNDGTARALDPAQTSYTLPTAGISGPLTIELLGENRGKTTSITTNVEIYRPATIASFTVNPTQLVNNVTASLNIAWDVPGATAVRIRGLEAFADIANSNAEQFRAVYDQTGQLNNIVVIPSQPISVVLEVDDERGETQVQSIEIPLIQPECTAKVDAPLRDGPDTNYPADFTIPSGSIITAERRNSDGAWLRVLLPDGRTGWVLLASFDCSPNFNPQDLQADANITPMPTTEATIVTTPSGNLTPLPTAIPATRQPTQRPPAGATVAPTVRAAG
jgi:hypothetical protein